MKVKKIIGEISKTILCLLAGLIAMLLVYGSILYFRWGAILFWGGFALFVFIVYAALAWARKEEK